MDDVAFAKSMDGKPFVRGGSIGFRKSLEKFSQKDWSEKQRVFRGHTSSVEWCYFALGLKNVTKEDAPDPGIWDMFRLLRKDPKARLKFQLDFLKAKAELSPDPVPGDPEQKDPAALTRLLEGSK